MKTDIWIADDDIDDVYFYCQALQLLQWPQVRPFVSGREVLRQLDIHPCDLPGLLILDGHMPPLGGIEVLRALQSDGRFTSIAVVMITGDLSSSEKLAAAQLGVPVFNKPSSQAELFGLLRSILLTFPRLTADWLSTSN